MSARYSRVFTLPNNLHTDGSPVLIAAGALLKDNETGNILVQLKLRNVSKETIKAVKVKVNAYDISSEPLEGVKTFTYLDLYAKANDEFGQQTPILLPSATTRSFSVEILSVVYTNGEMFSPAISSVAQAATKEVLEEIQLVDAETAVATAKATKEKKYRQLLKICAIAAFIFAALSVTFPSAYNAHRLWKDYSHILEDVGYFNFVLSQIAESVQLGFKLYPYAFLLALVAPGICLFTAFNIKRNHAILKPAVIICTTIFTLQIVSNFLPTLSFARKFFFVISISGSLSHHDVRAILAIIANLIPSAALLMYSMYSKKTK